MADANNQIMPVAQGTVNLSDISPKDKVWDNHRSSTSDVQSIYQQNNEFKRYAHRMGNCSGFLGFAETVNLETGEIGLKLRRANFCRVRTCPVCQWRRTLLWKARFYQALPELEKQNPTARFIFLTLTVRNCEIDALKETLKAMHTAFRKLIKRAEIKDAVLGWVRTTEVTQGADGTAHPHYHCLVMVSPSYFGKKYIKQERFVEMWKESLKVSYDPNVDVRAVRSNTGSKDQMTKAVAETLKYTVKPSDLTMDKNWLYEYTRQVHKLRFIDSGGLLKNVLKESTPETDNDMIFVDGEEPSVSDETEQLRHFYWDGFSKRYKG